MKKVLLTVLFAFASFIATAQVGVGTPTPNPSAELHISAADKGVLIPQIELKSLTDNSSITAGNVNSLLVFNPSNANGVTPGYYYWWNGKWEHLTSTGVANVFYDGNDFYYIDNNGNRQLIDIENLIQSQQFHYTIDADSTNVSNVNITKVVDSTTNSVTYTIDVQSAMPQFFYMPAILFETSTQGTQTKDLYQEYINQFTGVNNTTFVSSTGAPTEIPHLPAATDLYYYVTHYDDTVIDNVSIDANGVLSYDVIDNANPYSYISIVFVVKTN